MQGRGCAEWRTVEAWRAALLHQATRPLCMLRRLPCDAATLEWWLSLHPNLAVEEEDKQRSAGQADKVGNLRGETKAD